MRIVAMARRFRAKVSNFFHRERAEREMGREVASHLALLEDDFRLRGMSPEDAARAGLSSRWRSSAKTRRWDYRPPRAIVFWQAGTA